jgi:hypothetical protein
MKAIALLAACGLATVAGCQTSKDKDVDTTHRPSAHGEMEMGTSSTAGYTMSATATRDTEWAASTDPSAARGTLRAGDRVMFNRMPDASMEWQMARTADGRTVYVRPADFRMAASTK